MSKDRRQQLLFLHRQKYFGSYNVFSCADPKSAYQFIQQSQGQETIMNGSRDESWGKETRC